MTGTHGNGPRLDVAARRPIRQRIATSWALALAICVQACSAPATRLDRRPDDLDAAPLQSMRVVFRGRVELDAAWLAHSVPIGPRDALVQVDTPDEWRLLSELDPGVRLPRRPFKGALVGLLSLAGRPLEGGAPASIRAVRGGGGVGLLIADVSDGVHFPEATAFADFVVVPGVRRIVELEINGDRFQVPQPGNRDHSWHSISPQFISHAGD